MKNRKRFIRYKIRMKKLAEHGWWHRAVCPTCGNRIFSYDRYDADCCLVCNIWLTPSCGEPSCPYCSARPDSPSKALFLENGRKRNPKEWLRKNYQHKDSGRLRREKRRRYCEENCWA